MDIKMMVGDKELISPMFDFRVNNTKNSLMLCIKGLNIEEQKNFSRRILTINKDKFILNADYIALNYEDIIYFFELDIN